MEETITQGSLKLIDYGVLGIMLLLFIGAIVYLNKQNAKMTERLLAAKDKQIEEQQVTIRDHVTNQDRNIADLTANVRRLIDLYGLLERTINDLPDRILLKRGQD